MSEQIPREHRRGLDGGWGEERGDWIIAQVAAPCARGAEAIARLPGMHGPPLDALAPDAKTPHDDPHGERLVFVFQLRGHDWTLLESRAGCFDDEIAQKLSAKLAAKALMYAFESTGGVFGYTLYENGRTVEEYATGDTPAFDDSNRAENIADGWQLSDDNSVQLRSERRRGLDMNAEEITNLPGRIARELGLYIPCDVWQVDPKTGRIGLQEPWTRGDFADARIVSAEY